MRIDLTRPAIKIEWTPFLLMNIPTPPSCVCILGATPRIYLAWGGAVMSPSESQRNPRTARANAHRTHVAWRPSERFHQRYGLLRGRTIFNFTLKRLARFDLRIDSSARRYPIAAEVLRSSNELRFLSGVLLARIRRHTVSMGSAALHPRLTKSAALPLATSASKPFSHASPTPNAIRVE